MNPTVLQLETPCLVGQTRIFVLIHISEHKEEICPKSRMVLNLISRIERLGVPTDLEIASYTMANPEWQRCNHEANVGHIPMLLVVDQLKNPCSSGMGKLVYHSNHYDLL
jgi:hypothetical protein